MIEYSSIPGLHDVLLEDSYVLGITATPGRLSLVVDLALLPGHPDFAPAPAGEAHCYRRAEVEFVDVEKLSWSGQGGRPAFDANGEIDYGNVDTFHGDGDKSWVLTGDWGELRVRARGILVSLK